MGQSLKRQSRRDTSRQAASLRRAGAPPGLPAGLAIHGACVQTTQHGALPRPPLWPAILSTPGYRGGNRLSETPVFAVCNMYSAAQVFGGKGRMRITQ